ncbi:hypothetical protein AB3347_21180 [Massilia sp. X63]
MENGHPRVAIFYLFHGGEKQSPCGLCVVAKAAVSKPCAYSRKGGLRDVGESFGCSAKKGLEIESHPSGGLYLSLREEKRASAFI